MFEREPVLHSREEAREVLVAKIEDQTRLRDKIVEEQKLPAFCRTTFTTIDPNYLIQDAEWRLRWIDCAPEGANHNVAPMQDKRGVPMGPDWNENVGPCQALREARIARGLNPFSGEPVKTVEAARKRLRRVVDRPWELDDIYTNPEGGTNV